MEVGVWEELHKYMKGKCSGKGQKKQVQKSRDRKE